MSQLSIISEPVKLPDSPYSSRPEWLQDCPYHTVFALLRLATPSFSIFNPSHARLRKHLLFIYFSLLWNKSIYNNTHHLSTRQSSAHIRSTLPRPLNKIKIEKQNFNINIITFSFRQVAMKKKPEPPNHKSFKCFLCST